MTQEEFKGVQVGDVLIYEGKYRWEITKNDYEQIQARLLWEQNMGPEEMYYGYIYYQAPERWEYADDFLAWGRRVKEAFGAKAAL